MTCSVTCHASIVLSQEEAYYLEAFFQFVFGSTEAGYVIEDVKPMCVLGIGSGDECFMGFPSHQTSVILREGIRVWNQKIATFQKNSNYIIHSYNETDSVNSNFKYILFINKELFLRTIDENLYLFQYLLGPSVTAEKILGQILSKDATFSGVLDKHNNVLVGILLGYGTKNAITVSRLEEIKAYSQSGDVLPYLPMHRVSGSDCSIYFREDDKPWSHDVMEGTFGYKTVEEEYNDLNSKISLPPENLINLSPQYLFAYCSDDVKSEKLIQALLLAQKKIRFWLKHDSFLEKSLSFFVNEPLEIRQQEGGVKKTDYERDADLIARKMIGSLEKLGYSSKEIQLFINGFENPDDKEGFVQPFTGSPSYIERIDSARFRVEEANRFFYELSERKDVVSVVPFYLYYKRIEKGGDFKINSFSKVCLDYLIYHPDGHILVDKKKEWVDLSKTVPGFAHGLKDMSQGETRLLFIHPVYGYGMRTFSEKGLYLTVKLTLNEISKDYSNPLSALTENDALKILQSEWYQQEKKNHEMMLRNKGKHFYRFISKRSSFNSRHFINQLRYDLNKNLKKKKTIVSDNDEIRASQLFWESYQQEK